MSANLSSRLFSRDQFPNFLKFVAENARDRWPSPSRIMTGDVAWRLPAANPKQNLRLWYDGEAVVGYAWFEPTSAFHYDIKAGARYREALSDDMIAWAEEMRMQHPPGTLAYLEYDSMAEWAEGIRNPRPVDENAGRILTVGAFESDDEAIRLLEGHGYAASKHFEPFLAHDLVVPDVDPPKGVTIRHVEASDFEAYVAGHRAAWAPSDGFSMDHYLKVRNITEVFDPTLNLVAEVSPGKFASCTIFWADPVSRIGSIEPFGTDPDYRGTGISKAVIHEGLRRLKAKGMKYGEMSTAGFNHQAVSLYQSCGYRLVDRSRTFTKEIASLTG